MENHAGSPGGNKPQWDAFMWSGPKTNAAVYEHRRGVSMPSALVEDNLPPIRYDDFVDKPRIRNVLGSWNEAEYALSSSPKDVPAGSIGSANDDGGDFDQPQHRRVGSNPSVLGGIDLYGTDGIFTFPPTAAQTNAAAASRPQHRRSITFQGMTSGGSVSAGGQASSLDSKHSMTPPTVLLPSVQSSATSNGGVPSAAGSRTFKSYSSAGAADPHFGYGDGGGGGDMDYGLSDYSNGGINSGFGGLNIGNSTNNNNALGSGLNAMSQAHQLNSFSNGIMIGGGGGLGGGLDPTAQLNAFSVNPMLVSNDPAVQLQFQMQQAVIARQQQWMLAMQQQQQQQLHQVMGGGNLNGNQGRGNRYNNNNGGQMSNGGGSAGGQYFSNNNNIGNGSGGSSSPGTRQMMSKHHSGGGGHHNNNNVNNSGGVNIAVDTVLLEYKTTGQRPRIEDLKGHVFAFASDAHGSRFLQYQMELARPEEKEALVLESLSNAVQLMQDTFGNYVIQNFLEHATPHSRRALAEAMRGSMLALSVQPHGCRVVQRALDLVDIDQRNILLEELLVPRGNVFQASRNTHATHVLQKTVSILRRDSAAEQSGDKTVEGSIALMRAMEKAVADDVVQLLLHPHAYRLVLNVLGDCDRNRSAHVSRAVETIAENRETLCVDQHGNFMLQHMLDNNEANGVLDFVQSRLVELSQHKFGSHLVEKCFAVAIPSRCSMLVEEILRPKSERNISASKRLRTAGSVDWDGADSPALALMMDPYANFVVQKAFDRIPPGSLKTEMTNLVQENAELLGRFTYGRHILAHVNVSRAQGTPPGGGSGGGSAPQGMYARGPMPIPPQQQRYFPRSQAGPRGGGIVQQPR